MKTLLIDASPKKRFSNSAYFLGFSRLFMSGRKNRCMKAKLPRTAHYDDIFAQIADAGRLVLATPLYVDGLPSHVLRFLMALETYCNDNNVTFDLYVLANCGFYEGRQTRHLMEQVEAWCKRTRVNFRGGVGIGAGEMLGFIRILPFIYVLIALVTTLISLLSGGQLLEGLDLLGLGIRMGTFVIFSLLAAVFLIRLGLKVKNGKPLPVCYTTVCCPKFLFTWFATVYWLLRMLVMHGKLPHSAFHREVTETK
jgi:hypothetical protein